ncbi:MAG: hypothetical protein NTU63_03060 [Candidatus Pacearchaeota archaeon]|nr:hypothetical protein [Candidatus Pacearchaeota archaeon]
MVKKRFVIYFVSILIVIVIILYVGISTGWMSKITGWASTRPANFSVTITGTNPVKFIIWNNTLIGATVDPTEGLPTDVPFIVTVIDIDGASDLNDSSVIALFNQTGVERTNLSACSTMGQSNATSKNYTCTVRMWYWDDNSTWTINVSASDLGNRTVISNTSKAFVYGFLKGIIINPNLTTWPALTPGDTNETSKQNTTLNNTGNVLINPNWIKINAIDLQGMVTTTKYLNVSNFTTSWDANSDVGMCANNTVGTNTGTLLVNATDVGIVGANLSRGNVSAANATSLGQETLYFCIPNVPMITSQTYATNNSGAWTIKV